MVQGSNAAAQEPSRDALTLLGVAMPQEGERPRVVIDRVSQQLEVVVRVSLTPAVIALGLLADERAVAFWPLVLLRILLQCARAVSSRSRHAARSPYGVDALVDLVVIAGLVAASGAGDSPLRIVLVAMPLAAGFLYGPRLGAGLAAVMLATYLVPTLVDPFDAGPPEDSVVLVTVLGMLYAAAAGAVTAIGRERLAAHASEVDAGRRRLMTASLSAEDVERRRVSHDLHGEALQVLLAAAQDLDEGDPAALRRAREELQEGIAFLRHTVRDLHPAALRHVSLEVALQAALQHRVRGEVVALVGPEAEQAREAMLLSLVREIGDALGAARLDEEVQVVLTRASAGVRLLVTSQGAGPGGSMATLAESLAGCRERVEADGGTLAVDSPTPAAARVLVELPLVRRPGDATPASAADGTEEDAGLRRLAQIMLAALRVLLVPLMLVDALVEGDPGTWFWVLAVPGAAAQVGALVLSLGPHWERYPRTAGAVADLVLFALVVAAAGGIRTELAAVAVLLPFLFVLYHVPRLAARLSLLLFALMVAVALPDLLRGAPGAGDATAMVLVILAWTCLASGLVGLGRARVRLRTAALERARRRLLHDSLDAADAERRRLSERLHDGALQSLIVAGQDLEEGLEGAPEALELARGELRDGLRLLRDIVAELHPPALEHGGLRPALAAVVDRARSRAGYETRVEVGPAASGLRDELVVSLVRELVANATRHAQASLLVVRVVRERARLVVEVVDDGVGISDGRTEAALAAGHIGLASARERVEADGGELTLRTGPGAGTHVRITLPLTAAPQPA